MTRLLPPLHDGHAPITMLQLFGDAIDAYDDWDEGCDEPSASFMGEALPIGQIFDHMRDCTDILPNSMLAAVRERLTKPWNSDSPLDEMTVSTAARVMSILVRKRNLQHGDGDLARFVRRMERQRAAQRPSP